MLEYLAAFCLLGDMFSQSMTDEQRARQARNARIRFVLWLLFFLAIFVGGIGGIGYGLGWYFNRPTPQAIQQPEPPTQRR
jgi:hypothetical protein